MGLHACEIRARSSFRRGFIEGRHRLREEGSRLRGMVLHRHQTFAHRRQEGGGRRFKEMPRHDQRKTPPVSLDSHSGTSAGRLGTEGPRRLTLIRRMGCRANGDDRRSQMGGLAVCPNAKGKEGLFAQSSLYALLNDFLQRPIVRDYIYLKPQH